MGPVFDFFKVLTLASIRSSFMSNLEKVLKISELWRIFVGRVKHHWLVARALGPLVPM